MRVFLKILLITVIWLLCFIVGQIPFYAFVFNHTEISQEKIYISRISLRSIDRIGRVVYELDKKNGDEFVYRSSCSLWPWNSFTKTYEQASVYYYPDLKRLDISQGGYRDYRDNYQYNFDLKNQKVNVKLSKAGKIIARNNVPLSKFEFTLEEGQKMLQEIRERFAHII